MTFTSGSKLRASDLNNLPYDTDLGGQARTTTSSQSTGTELIGVTTSTFTLLPNLWYAVDLDVFYSSTSPANIDQLEFRIRDTNVAGTSRAAIVSALVFQANGGPYFTRATYIFNSGSSPSPVNWVGTYQRIAGAGGSYVTAGTRIRVTQNPSTATFTTV